ncbi:hypothetical protein [Hydrogenivirga sp.]
MDRKQKLMSLLGSAVLLGLGAEGAIPAHAGEGKCAGMKPGEKTQQTKEATCAGMKKEGEEKTKKKKTKEMTCAGPGGCGGKMKKDESKS